MSSNGSDAKKRKLLNNEEAILESSTKKYVPRYIIYVASEIKCFTGCACLNNLCYNLMMCIILFI